MHNDHKDSYNLIKNKTTSFKKNKLHLEIKSLDFSELQQKKKKKQTIIPLMTFISRFPQ